MFLKSYRLKSSAALKGAEAKKLRARLELAFPHISMETLLPAKANVTQLKILTHGGIASIVYCVEKQPLFFELDGGQLVPTVYTMWAEPHILPYFTTHEGVLPKLSNGADLMLPGVVPLGVGLNMFGHFKKGQLIAVNVTNNNSAIGVGQLARNSDELYMCGGHGVAVKMLHMFGDKLWAHEPRMLQQIPLQQAKTLTSEDFPALGATKCSPAEQICVPEVWDAETNELETGTAGLSLEENGETEKTRHKKLSNFLAEMVDQGFIVVREETKGVDKIIAVDLEHPELVNFITDVKKGDSSGAAAETPLFHSELKEMYIVSDVTAAFFTKLNYKRGEGIPVNQIKKIVREYVSKHCQVDPQTKLTKPDEVLQELCGNRLGSLSEITSMITSKMEHSYQMCSGKDTSGKPQIQMSLATRSGNKKVTLVSNIEAYGIIMAELIKLCKQGAAASTSIVKLPHQKHEQLQVQGNQIRFIYTLLTETYKVPPKCILGLDLAKDGKKKRK
ncbi:GH23585 [Drosophila grimshawi]|uniref:GH23585 n=1 Tax=Drosophila grimshawi TaxID=7222 RepID=B4K3G3_DROGR|nr:GH23585 [Drosophila grimshawi]